MSPDERGAGRSFVLLCSVAGLSRAVLQVLGRRACRPRLILLPEYEPARPPGGDGLLHAGGARRDFPGWVDEVEIAYAPPARQGASAALIRQRSIEFMLVACWPYLLGEALIEAPSCAALNLHPSLLPAYRGPDPLGAQLARGDHRFGVTLHEMNRQFDQGDIVAQRALADPDPARNELERRCAELGVELFIDALESYPHWQRRAQPLQALDTV